MKNITIKQNVKLSDEISAFLETLDSFFIEMGILVVVVSCLRDKQKQLDIIIYYGKKYGLINYNDDLTLENKTTYLVDGFSYDVPCWQPVLEALLEKNILIAPIETITILTGRRKGQVRNPSDHIQGLAVDLDSLKPGIENLMKVYDAILEIKIKHPELNIRQLLLEKNQDCVHVGLKNDEQA